MSTVPIFLGSDYGLCLDFAFWPANRLGCFIVGTVLQIIANAASNCLTICSNKPSACHSFDDIFGRLT